VVCLEEANIYTSQEDSFNIVCTSRKGVDNSCDYWTWSRRMDFKLKTSL